MMEPDPSVPLNRDLALAAVQAQADPALRAVLMEALELATNRFVQWDDLDDAAFAQQLPAAPFDLLFYIRVLERFFAHKDHIARTLDGLEGDPFTE